MHSVAPAPYPKSPSRRLAFALIPAVLFALLSPLAADAAAPEARPEALPAYGARLTEPASQPDDARFDHLVDSFLLEYFQAYPARATNVGIHDFDARLEATSRQAIEDHGKRLRGYLLQLRFIKPERLSPERRFDRKMLEYRLNGMVLDLETIREWQHDPNTYLGVVSGGVHALLKRDFAPLDERVRSVNARLAEVPRVFADARANLDNPPRIFTEVAISQGKGLVRFLEETVPALARGVQDAAVRSEFEKRNAAAVKAAREFVEWMEQDLLPRSQGDYALGEATYLKKLLYDEMVDVSVDSLLARGYRALEDTRRQMAEAAQAIEPGLSVPDALARLGQDAPSAATLVPSTQAGLDEIRRFLIERKLITVPRREDLRVAETPEFRRSLSFASMDSPGVLEGRASEAYYYVTPPDPSWSEDKQREHLTFYSPAQLSVISIHEAYPGHYYQFLSLRNSASLIRALFGPGSNSEGWAHYCEEMMIDEGFGGGDAKLRLAMLNLSLQRICRYIAGISMHTRGMTYDEAVALFRDQGYMAPVNAEREARRGTSDPTYLVYTLGKWEIQDLRDEYRRVRGSGFRLGEFHDRLLSYGRAPLALIREAMLAPGS